MSVPPSAAVRIAAMTATPSGRHPTPRSFPSTGWSRSTQTAQGYAI